MKENIKIGLLAVIAVTLIVNTVMLGGGESNTGSSDAAMSPEDAVSSIANSMDPNAMIEPNEPVVDNRPKTSMSFAETEFDFGNVKQETENKHIFKFTNTGEEPLVISNARGSCGCTVPNYPKEPIAPGESGEIEVVYSPGKQMNQQNKTVTITANTTPETTILKIKANVEVVEGEGGNDTEG